MYKLNFNELAILRELIKQSDKNGMLSRSSRQIANAIGNVSHVTIFNYLNKFVSYGVASCDNKGTQRQSFQFNMEKIKKLLVNEWLQ